MASLTVNAARTPVPSEGHEVYVAAMPLRAAKGPAQLLMSAAYSLDLWNLQHYLVIVRPNSPSQPQAFVFDFQPQDPENLFVALAALSGRGVPGEPIMLLSTLDGSFTSFKFSFSSPRTLIFTRAFGSDFNLPVSIFPAKPRFVALYLARTVLVRKLTKLPKSKCWFIGLSHGDSIHTANKFNESWQTELSIGQHDCRHYTNGLVEYLTGEEHVLKRLRGSLAD